MPNDGFSDPDGAEVLDEYDEDDLELVAENGALLDLGTSGCQDCVHFNTCAIFKGFAPMMQDWPQEEHGDEPPVDPTNLALICESFEVEETPTEAEEEKN